MSNPSYRIELKSLPDTVDAGARLQRLLKCALRSFGFRCKRIEEIPPTVTKGDDPKTRKPARGKRKSATQSGEFTLR